MILAFILDNQLGNAKTANSILPEFHLSETWILAKSCEILQFDFSLLVNGKSMERKVFSSRL